MKIGEVSDPIKTQNTIIFLKVLDKRLIEPKKIDLVKLKEKLINDRKK